MNIALLTVQQCFCYLLWWLFTMLSQLSTALFQLSQILPYTEYYYNIKSHNHHFITSYWTSYNEHSYYNAADCLMQVASLCLCWSLLVCLYHSFFGIYFKCHDICSIIQHLISHFRSKRNF